MSELRLKLKVLPCAEVTVSNLSSCQLHWFVPSRGQYGAPGVEETAAGHALLALAHVACSNGFPVDHRLRDQHPNKAVDRATCADQ